MISIAMATYNGEKYLREQLDSILVQTIQDFELIACDDCSTDSTVQILNEYAKRDSRIKVFVNEENLGFKKNFERAIGLCSGEYIALSDQDDVWLPEHLEVLSENIGDKDLIGGNSLLVDENNNEMGMTFLESIKHNKNLPRCDYDFFFLILHQNIFQGGCILFSKALLKYAFPIPKNVSFHDWWLALVACEYKGVEYIDKCISRYRQHKKNIIGSPINKNKNECTVDAGYKANTLMELLKKSASEYTRIIQAAIEYHLDIEKKSLKQIPYLVKNYYKIFRNINPILFILPVACRMVLR